jgi:hypothetical protein
MKRRRWPWVLAAIALFIAGGVEYDKLQFRRTGYGFRHVTGQELPPNVAALAHGSATNDSLYHTTHYWRLRGPRENLRELAGKFGLVRSDEDARARLQSAEANLPMATSEMIEGYEGSLDGGRDRWLMIVEPGDQAIFVY